MGSWFEASWPRRWRPSSWRRRRRGCSSGGLAPDGVLRVHSTRRGGRPTGAQEYTDAVALPVLVVDDDEAIRSLMVELLSSEGYRVHQARDGAEALRVIGEDGHPCVILLDLVMPGTNGWAFADAYRRLPGPRAPIVVTAANTEVDRLAAEVGADGYLAKPFDLKDLVEVVERVCGVAT